MSLDLEQALEVAHVAVRVAILPSGRCAIFSWLGDLSAQPEWICDLSDLPKYIRLEMDRRLEHWIAVEATRHRPRPKAGPVRTERPTPLTVTSAMDLFK